MLIESSLLSSIKDPSETPLSSIVAKGNRLNKLKETSFIFTGALISLLILFNARFVILFSVSLATTRSTITKPIAISMK